MTLTEDAEASSRNSSKNQDKKIVDARNDAAAYGKRRRHSGRGAASCLVSAAARKHGNY
ncbi:hypothetical protein NWF32_16860 [Pseudomonas qingdaonensis]|nr:hypothetical protein [Pseudomonas qingdaonensis]